MSKLFIKTCLVVSVLAHIFVFYAVQMFGTYDFTGPLNRDQLVMVNLGQQKSATSQIVRPASPQNTSTHDQIRGEVSAVENPVPPEEIEPVKKLAPNPLLEDKKTDSITPKNAASFFKTPAKTHRSVMVDPPLEPITAPEFQEVKNETLTYLISILGLPVGSAELEAKNVNGDILITLRVTSNAAISSFYAVDDLIETRHINGNFILTRIRQQEGSFRGDRGFTLFLRDKSVFWINRLTKRSQKELLPNSEVVDILSGLYFLRNRNLVVGTSEKLQIYDSDTYTEVPVDVIRRERIRLPSLREVDTLLVQPNLKTEGIFKRTGDVQIWLSDDQYKVPVKIVTSIVLGKVTAELVSAESKTPEKSDSK